MTGREVARIVPVRRRVRSLFAACLTVAVGGCVTLPPASPGSVAAGSLEARIDSILADTAFAHAHLGAAVAELPDEIPSRAPKTTSDAPGLAPLIPTGDPAEGRLDEQVRLSLLPTAAGQTGAAAACQCDGSAPARCDGDARALKTVTLGASGPVALQANVASLRFDPLYGTASPAATVRLSSAGGRVLQQVVNIMGRVRTCSPAGSMPGYRSC